MRTVTCAVHGRTPGRRWILDGGLRGGGPGRSPCWRTLKESCKGLGSVSLKINNQHTHTKTTLGSRSPDGWDQIPRWAGGWACTSHPGVLDSKREEPEKTGRHPVLKYRVPQGSNPREQFFNRYCSNKHTHNPVGSRSP